MSQLTFMAAVRVRDSRAVDDIVKLKVQAISSSIDDTTHLQTQAVTLTVSECISKDKNMPCICPTHTTFR